MTKFLLWALAAVVIVAALIFGPWLTFWTITTLFNTGATTFGFWQWLAALLFNLTLAGAGAWHSAK